MTTIVPAPLTVAPLTPELVSQTLGPMMVPMVTMSPQSYGNNLSPEKIANSNYVFFNRCILYLSIIFAILAIISAYNKQMMQYHQTFKNWAIGLLLLYIALVIFNYSDYDKLTGSQILFFH